MNEIRFRIGADTSAISRAFTHLQSVAAAAGAQIHKKFDLKEAFKSSVLALGLSIEKVSERVAEMFTGGSQEAWKSALRAAEEAARTIEESTMRRMDTVRQIEYLEKEIERNRAKESAAPQKTGELSMPRKVLDTIGEKMSAAGAKLFSFVGMSKASGLFSRAEAMYRRRGNEKGDGVESEAEAAQRSQETIAKRLADEARIAALREKQERDEQRIASARAELQRVSMTDEQKLTSLIREQGDLYEKIAAARLSGKDSAELELAALAKQKSVQELILEIQRKSTAEQEKQAAAREQFIEKYRRYLEAQQQVSSANKNVSDARHDALALTLDEAASGARGTSEDRAKARAILRDEETARRLYGSGRSVTLFDSKTQRNRLVGAEFFQNRAADMRKNMEKLTTSEQNPFSTVEKQLKEANEHLGFIEDSLKPKKLLPPKPHTP